MTIDIDNFVAINDKRPGKEAFRVFGTVTVANPGIEPVLSTPSPRHRGGWEVLRLDLIEPDSPSMAVMTTKPVAYEQAGISPWTDLEIQGCEGRLKIVTID
ncbi:MULTISPECIES: hypothetical protein [Pseudomonas]|jgi:hypothetical protein|nr:MULTISPECIES: hypothetical protein [Pseudomonas]ERT18581.1 hypothetical protein O162_10780 [Pseudomonas putida SJ3]PNB59997.1 hypothetical protein C1X73_09170 [Pseudomonas sp. FW305-130]PYG97150.1 hypothetical protein CVV67_29000 [Arthrobacter stackebrandtii]AGN83495.1 hypothetical protein L483_31890 [Pseudomonas putida H8234]EKT4449503.1 hypothetical protein [Pseudomonas putida]